MQIAPIIIGAIIIIATIVIIKKIKNYVTNKIKKKKGI